jgi:hypothetical protein
MYVAKNVSIFLIEPYTYANLSIMIVITASETTYTVSIQEAMPISISKS